MCESTLVVSFISRLITPPTCWCATFLSLHFQVVNKQLTLCALADCRKAALGAAAAASSRNTLLLAGATMEIDDDSKVMKKSRTGKSCTWTTLYYPWACPWLHILTLVLFGAAARDAYTYTCSWTSPAVDCWVLDWIQKQQSLLIKMHSSGAGAGGPVVCYFKGLVHCRMPFTKWKFALEDQRTKVCLVI